MKGLIGWLVILAIAVAINTFITFRYRAKCKQISYDVMCPDSFQYMFRFRMFVMPFIILGILTLVMTLSNYMMTNSELCEPVPSESVELYAINNTKLTEGRLFCLHQANGFTYCCKSPDGYYIIDDISSDDYTIRVSDSENKNPKLQYHTYDIKKDAGLATYFYCGWLDLRHEKPLVIIYIPEGTLESVYSISLDKGDNL